MVGFLKPIRDLTGTLIVYAIMVGFGTIRNSTIQNSNFSFNIWGFLAFFLCVSTFIETVSAACYDLKKGYRDPIDAGMRIFGFFVGTVVFSFLLIPIYYSIGGSIGDLIFSEIIASICMLIGVIVRLHYQPHY